MTAFQPANEQLGYFFHPATDANGVGHSQLDVMLRAAPTGDHFDPESLTVPIAHASQLTPLQIRHPWEQDQTYRVGVGEIVITDARPVQVKAFTFGGTLQIEADARRTLCRLASPAPLLERSRESSSLEEWIIEEVQILFAQRRALQDDDELERKLTVADPLQLYRACLQAIAVRVKDFPGTDDAHRHFKRFLREATESWQDETIPALADLL